MKQLMVTAFLAGVALVGLTADSQANGLFRKSRGGCGGCEAPCATPCAPTPVQYETRKVKVAKHVWVDKEVECFECKRFTREEQYNYTVCVPVTKTEKRTVMDCTTVTKEVPCTWTVLVPRTEKKMVECVTYRCERETICEQVPVCRTVCVPYVDECGRCCMRRETVTVMETRTRCVVKRIPEKTMREVCYTVCDTVVKTGTRTVCDIVRTPREVLVNVCSYEHKPMVGTRTVCEYKTVATKRMVKVCTTVWDEVEVRVPVCTTSCASPCSDCGATGHHRGGFFRRSSGCCN
jgi:hypothetical protein